MKMGEIFETIGIPTYKVYYILHKYSAYNQISITFLKLHPLTVTIIPKITEKSDLDASIIYEF